MRWVVAVLAMALAGGAAGAQGQSLMQTVRAERYSYGPRDKILIEYAIRNVGDQSLVYNFASAKQYNIWITRGGDEVFRLSKGRVYIQMMTTLILKPGESRSFFGTWDQTDPKGKQVEPGIYTINAQLLPSRGLLDATNSTPTPTPRTALRSARATGSSAMIAAACMSSVPRASILQRMRAAALA